VKSHVLRQSIDHRVKSAANRFWAKVDKNGPIPSHRPELGQCWIWTGALCRGYGYFRDVKMVPAHRFVWELAQGNIPARLEIDHLCRVRNCVNPKHLEPVTKKVNVLRGAGITAINKAKNHCKHGHPFTPENTFVMKRKRKGGRVCRACAIIYDRKRKGRKAA
jgi:hypothetical protein